MWRVGLLLVATLGAVARADDPRAHPPADPRADPPDGPRADPPADPRDVFGLGKNNPSGPSGQPSGPSGASGANDPRDVFGLRPKVKEEPLDCNDGTAFGCTGASDPMAEAPPPYALSTWLPARYLLTLPVGDATHDGVAHYGLGIGLDGAGPSVAGATGLENRWTLEGAPIDNMRTGGVDTRVPLAFLDGLWASAGGFAARDRTSTGGTFEARLRRGTKQHVLELYGWAGYTAPSRERPIPPFTYQVRRGHLDIGPEASAYAVATGPVNDRVWYAGGLGVEVNSVRVTWTAGTVRDRDGNGVVDGLPGVVPTDRISRYSRRPVTLRTPFMLHVGAERGASSVEAALVGSVGTDVSYLYNSTLQAAGTNGLTLQGDAIVTYRANWNNTRARVQAAWHRTSRDESARDPDAANKPQLLSAYIPEYVDEDEALDRACSDTSPDDPYPMVTNCPVPVGWFTSGGAGALVDTTGDRPSLTADIAHKLSTTNVLRAGATGEDTRLITETRLTGGYQVRSLFPEHMSERRFADPDAICNTELALACPTVDTSVLRYRTRYTAAYVEDSWQATKDVTVDGGLRWELMWVGPVLHFSDQFAPRLGASWDPLGGGRSRVWTSMGRSYAMLPTGLGPTILERSKTVDHIVSSFGEGRAVDTGAVFTVASGVEPIAQDELTTGAQLALARTVRATVWLQGRWLRRGLDTTTGGFDNPGRAGGTPAIRQTGLVAAELATAPTGTLTLRAGYMYGRTIGSWTGAFDPREGAVLYAGSDYDSTSANLLGRLPTDMGHRTYVEAVRHGHFGGLPIAFAMRLTLGSGRPRSAIADAEDGIIHLIPRGSVGRGPMLTQTNIRMSTHWHGLDIALDVLNLFNRREAVSVDEIYTTGAVRPIDRGAREDLIWLKTDTGLESTRRSTYSHATSYQAPISALLGIRQTF